MARRKSLFGRASQGSWLGRSRKQPESDLDITPMIDVTFLLLIFFMVTSTMQANAELDIPPADHGVGVDSASSTVITIMLEGSSGPTIILGDTKGRQGTLEEVRSYVEEGIRENRSQVIIKADREVPHGFVQEVTKTVASVEGVQFFIGVKDKTRR